MAITEFYMTPTGSNLNSGSTANDAATLTYASGNLATVTGTWTFTPASGNPQTDGVQVGDRVSIYADGASVTPFIGLVTNVTSTTIQGLSTSNRFGTIPSDGTGNRTLKLGGAFADLGIVASGGGGAMAANNAAYATRINVKAGTYSYGSTSRTIAVGGTTTIPVIYRGYKTTAGDMDGKVTSLRVSGTDVPLFSFGDANLTISGAYITGENFDVTSARTAAATLLVGGSGTTTKLKRVRVSNTNAGASSRAVTTSGASSGSIFQECYFEATSTATSVVNATAAAAFQGCVVTGGGIGIEHTTGQLTVLATIFKGIGSHGIQCIAPTIINLCSFASVGGDGIRFTTVTAVTPSIVSNNVFASSGGYDINNTAAATGIIYRSNNLSYSPTSGHETGFGDSPNYHPLTDVATPYNNAAGGDYSLASGSNGAGAAIPGVFEGVSTTGHGDLGAAQRAAGGGTIFNPLGTSVIRAA